MRGEWHHNHMVEQLADVLLEAGARVQLEHPIRVDDRTLAADLYACAGGQSLLVEVERTPDRIQTDLLKAETIRANWCVIVLPNGRVRRAVLRKLGTQALLSRCHKSRIVVWTYAVALQRVTELLSIEDSLLTPTDIKSLMQ